MLYIGAGEFVCSIHSAKMASLVSKDVLPLCSRTEFDYNAISGASNDTSGRKSARWNCCWLEVSIHTLLSDPYIRYFVNDYWRRNPDAPKHFKALVSSTQLVDPNLQKEYIRGKTLMEVLVSRLYQQIDLKFISKLSAQQQVTFDNEITNDLTKLRDQDIGFGELDKGSDDRNEPNMGDPGDFMLLALPALSLFIQYNWSGNLLQQHYRLYGAVHRDLLQRECSEPSCTYKQNVVLEQPFMRIRLREGVRNVLEPLLNAALATADTAKWILPEANPYCSNGHKAIAKRQLLTLPWILRFQIDRQQHVAVRDEDSSEVRAAVTNTDAPLLFNPEEMLVGPTKDGQHAVYKLLSYVRYYGHHYKICVRLPDNSFQEWNFNAKSSFQMEADPNSPGLKMDRLCVFMTWIRTE